MTENRKNFKLDSSSLSMRKVLLTVILSLFIISFVSATYTVEQPFIKGQTSQLLLPCKSNGSDCSAATTCNVSIKNPLGNPVVLNLQMTTTYYPYWNMTLQGNSLNTLGTYQGDYTCDTGSAIGTDQIKLEVSNNGDSGDSLGIIAISIILIALTALFASIGFSIGKEHWIIKSAMFMGAMLVMVLAVNTALNFAIGERLSSMMQNVLTISLITIALFLVFIIVNYLKSIARALRDAKDAKESEGLT